MAGFTVCFGIKAVVVWTSGLVYWYFAIDKLEVCVLFGWVWGTLA